MELKLIKQAGKKKKKFIAFLHTSHNQLENMSATSFRTEANLIMILRSALPMKWGVCVKKALTFFDGILKTKQEQQT